MKKYILILLSIFLLLGVCSCNVDEGEGPNDDEDTDVSSGYDYTCITTDKETYYYKDKITVYLHNTDSSDFVAITEYGREPTNKYALLKRQVKDSTVQVFNAEKLNGTGDYTIFLYENGYEVIDSINIHIDGDDTNNYQVSSASLNVSNDKLSSYVTINTAYTNELTYRLFWAKNDKRLADYMAITTVNSKDLESFNINLPNNLFMPGEANQIEIEVVEGVSNSYFLEVGDELKLTPSKYLFTFNALSDIHIQSKNDSAIFNSHLRMGLRDMYSSKSEAIFVVGDTINMSAESDYLFYKSILDEEITNLEIPIYNAVGNHEYMYQNNMMDALNLFKEQFNLDSHYYSVELNGCKFIVLGSDDISPLGIMNNIQFQWLKQELASTDKNKPTFIFMHQPLKDTVAGSLETMFGQQDYGFGSSREALRSLLKDYPNAILFSGHSHYTLESYQSILYGNGIDASFVNCGSMAYVTAFEMGDIGGSEGYYVEVYEDYILLKGKEFVYNKWVAGAQFVLPLTVLK